MSKVDLHTKIDFFLKRELRKISLDLGTNISKFVEASIRMGIEYAKKKDFGSIEDIKILEEMKNQQIENNTKLNDGVIYTKPLDSIMDIYKKEKQRQTSFEEIMKKREELNLEMEKRALQKTWPILTNSQKTTYVESKIKKLGNEAKKFFEKVGISKKEYETYKNRNYA